LLIVTLPTFVPGEMMSAALHVPPKVPLLSSVAAGIGAYVVFDLTVERARFGHVG
jgi:hypothetical protein